MFEVMVEDCFSSARHLIHYDGECSHVHGHNFVVKIWAQGETLDEANVFIDYVTLKKELKKITSQLDHRNLNELPDFKGISPSTEYLAYYIYQGLKPHIPAITKVAVCESEIPKTCAYYWDHGAPLSP